MAKFQSPLLGYNNNVRHRGRIFHIQTEDSGVNHPHIITHLFMDGGRILKSFKRSYAEHVGSDKLSETVRLLMKEQHKAMFIALRDGQFDHLLEPEKDEKKEGGPPAAKVDTATAAKAKPAAKAEPAAQAEAAPAPKVEGPKEKEKEKEKELAPPPTEARANDVSPVTVRDASLDDAPPQNPDKIPSFIEELAPDTTEDRRTEIEVPSPADSDESLPVVELGPIVAAAGAEVLAAAAEAPSTIRDSDKCNISIAELTLDFDALERDSHAPGPYLPANDLPPPPQNLFAKKPRTATYSTVEPSTHHDWVPPPSRPAAPVQTTTQKPPSEGRYAPARPAAIFGASSSSSPKPASHSIFSDDLISDKSLDEVILAYLAEDLDPPRRE
jgi:hypothetical protein